MAHKKPAPPPVDNACHAELALANQKVSDLMDELVVWMDKTAELERLLGEERAKGKSLEDAKKVSLHSVNREKVLHREIDETRTKIGLARIYQ